VSSEPTSSAGATPGDHTVPGAGASPPSEQELREAYEAELSAITSAEMIFQAAVSLLNIAGYRLAASRAQDADPPHTAGDLDQVRDAIDAVRALLPVLERTRPAEELRPLRDALSQLQMAYAREAASAPGADAGAGQDAPGAGAGPGAGTAAPGAPPGEVLPSQPSSAGGSPAGESPTGRPQPEPPSGEPPKGPAEASGRLWVPGR
jgi:hypothetical protein